MTALRVVSDAGESSALAYPADAGRRRGATLVLAHGAGAGQHHPFMSGFASALAVRGVDVMTFNFPYIDAKGKVPDRVPVLEACFRAVVAAAATHPQLEGNALFVGGKSMGGRIASHLAAAGDDFAAGLRGLILLGYPLHPPGKPDQLRSAHLPAIRVPVLCLQGTRDPFGSPEELDPHFRTVPGPVTIHAVEGGDHSLAPRKGGPRTAQQVYADLQDLIAGWIARGLGRAV